MKSNELFNANIGLIEKSVKASVRHFVKHHKNKFDIEDMEQEMYVFLWKKLERFDYRRSAVNTYIINQIRYGIKDYLRKHIGYVSLYEWDKLDVVSLSETVTNDDEALTYAETIASSENLEGRMLAKELVQQMFHHFRGAAKSTKVLKALCYETSTSRVMAEVGCTQQTVHHVISKCRLLAGFA